MLLICVSFLIPVDSVVDKTAAVSMGPNLVNIPSPASVAIDSGRIDSSDNGRRDEKSDELSPSVGSILEKGAVFPLWCSILILGTTRVLPQVS